MRIFVADVDVIEVEFEVMVVVRVIQIVVKINDVVIVGGIRGFSIVVGNVIVIVGGIIRSGTMIRFIVTSIVRGRIARRH